MIASKEEGGERKEGTSSSELGGGETGGGDEKGHELAQHQPHQSPLRPYLLPLLANRAAQRLGTNDRHVQREAEPPASAPSPHFLYLKTKKKGFLSHWTLLYTQI